jgi:hypothetical protein
MHEYLEADKQNDLIKTPDKNKKKITVILI